jgi:hypothetical protein
VIRKSTMTALRRQPLLREQITRYPTARLGGRTCEPPLAR